MNSISSFRFLRGQCCREVITALIFAGLLLQSATAAAPEWWATQDVLLPGAAPDDFAAANLGQLKTLARKAAQEMNDTLPGGAGAAINALIESWEAAPAAGVTRDDYAAVNLGQLKTVGRLFYDRLAAVGARATGSYPWTGLNPDDFAGVNLGQVKTVFGFAVPAPPPPQIVTTFLPDSVVNSSYNVTIQAASGTPAYSFSLSGGSLPDGLGLDASSGVISGTTQATTGVSTFTVRVTDQAGRSATQEFYLAVSDGGSTGGGNTGGGGNPPPLTITTTDAQLAATVGELFSRTLTASGGNGGPYTFTVEKVHPDDVWPEWLVVSTDGKTLSGTPSALGLCNMLVRVTDGNATSTKEVQLSVNEPLAFLTDAALPGVQRDNAYEQRIETSGGYGQPVFSKIAGILPQGVTLSTAGWLTGTPTAAGTTTFSVRATDEAGHVKERQFTLVVSAPPPPLSIVTTQLPDAMAGWNYAGGLVVTGSGTKTFSATGLPDWLTLSPDGTFFGTPPDTAAVGLYQFEVTVQDEVYDPTLALNRRTTATITLSVIANQPAQINLLGGNHQTGVPGSQLAEPLAVRVTLNQQPMAGVAVSFNGYAATTDASGIASTTWVCPNGEGGFQVTVTCGAGTALFQAWAVLPLQNQPAVTNADPIAGAAPPAATTQNVLSSDPAVAVESHYVSAVGGEVNATWSEHVYLMAAQGAGRTQLWEDGGAEYTNTKKNWSTSAGTSGTEPPNNATAVSNLTGWIPGATEGYHYKGADTPYGRVDGVSSPYGGGLSYAAQTFLIRGAFAEAGWFGRASGYYKQTESEVRIRRLTPIPTNPPAGSAPPQAITRSFLLATYETSDTFPYEILKQTEVKPLTINANRNESDPLQLTPTSNTAGKGVRQRLLPIEVKVTDFATKSDTVPYVATTNATPPKNSELCLKADKTNEKAKIEIELPSITDTTMLSKLKWKVVKKPADTMVSEGVFGGATPPSAELSLGSGSSVEDEILFEVQVGADGSSFTPAAKMNVRVVRDRLNWWFEPFSSDFGWRTAKPEPRADTGDYPAHKANAYKRESLQSVYDFFKSSTAIGPSTPKANWAKSSITCFGQFHDALKTANGNNPLVDLTSLARIDMTAVTELTSFDLKYGALRSALGKQTTYPSDANPTLRATQFPERVQFATAAAAAVGDANLTRARLMALWTREGSMDVSSQHTRTGYNPWPIGFGAAVSAAPASEPDAKAIFIYDVAYICLGSDFLLKHSGGADNEPDLRDYPAALAHFKSTADATGGAGIGDRIVSNLTVAGSAGSYTVSANGAFYEDMLTLAGKHFVSVWQAEGPDATYMAYNMGVAKFNQMKATIGNASYPERGRLGLMDWAIHYEIRSGEWDQPRDFAQKFHAYRMAFEAKYP